MRLKIFSRATAKGEDSWQAKTQKPTPEIHAGPIKPYPTKRQHTGCSFPLRIARELLLINCFTAGSNFEWYSIISRRISVQHKNMANGVDSTHADDDDNRPNNHSQSPTPAYGYPSHGYNAQNPPTNLWSNNMAVTTNQIPNHVVITNFNDAGSLASALTSTPAVSTPATTPQKLQQIQQPLQQNNNNIQPNQNRAIHRINLSSIRHNYNEVQSSAAKQQCDVIVVVKADGYGHGAILTACHLVEHCGASAFAVATLEEGIALRRAFEEKFPTFTRERILVLGAPVGYPH